MTAHLVSGKIQFEVIGGDRLRMTSSCVVHVLGRDWTILPGDETDLASFPWFGYLLYDPFEGAAASVWHDQRCKDYLLSQKDADKGWYLLAIAGHSPETRMPKWKAYIGWLALRFHDRFWRQGLKGIFRKVTG